jgi:hypothetical protein
LRSWKVFILLSVLIASACKDSPNSLGDDFIPNNDKYTFYQADTSAAKDSTYYSESYPEAKAYTEDLIVGKYGDYQSYGFLRFPMSAPDSIISMLKAGTINIKSTWVSMVSNLYLGDSTANYDFTVHRITSDISLDSISSRTFPGITYDDADISTARYHNDTLTTFQLNNSIVTNWIMRNSSDSSSYDKNYGIILKPTASTNKAKGFLGYSTSLGTAVMVYFVYEKPGVYVDTLSAFSTQNSYYATKPFPAETDKYMYINGTVTYKNKIQFKLPKLPTNAVMNLATLEMWFDSTKSDIAGICKTTYDALGTTVVAGYVTKAGTTTIDTSSVLELYRLTSPNRHKYKGDITAFVQKWINTGNNYGLILSLYDEEYDPSKLVFCGANYPVVSMRPRLRITYSLRNNN